MLEAWVQDGRLVAADETAFGNPANLPGGLGTDSVLVIGQGDAVVEIEDGAPSAASAWVGFALEDESTLKIGSGAFQAFGLEIGDVAGTEVGHATFAGGGTLDLGDTPVTGVAGSTLTIADGGTLRTYYPTLADATTTPAGVFRVEEDGTLEFAGATAYLAGGNNNSPAIGSLEPNATLRFGAGLTGPSDRIIVTRNGADPGLLLTVDPDAGRRRSRSPAHG